MKPTTIVLLAVAVGVLGTWSEGKMLTQKQITGSIVVLIFLSIMGDTVPKVAEPFAWLILASMVGSYGDKLFSRVGQLVGSTDNSSAIGKTGTQKDNNSPMFRGGLGAPMQAQ